MASTAELAARLGVSEDVVAQVIASTSAETASATGPMVGYGRCQNVECDEHGVLMEVSRERHTKTVMAEDMPVAITHTHYDVYADGAEFCPSCMEPRALLPEKPRKIPKMI
jgi:hypothetical protein